MCYCICTSIYWLNLYYRQRVKHTVLCSQFIFGVISGSGFAVFVALLALFVDATLIILHLLFVPEFHLNR